MDFSRGFRLDRARPEPEDLAQARAVVYAGYRARFTSAVVLAQELLAAQDEHRLPRYLRSWQKTGLVIVDEPRYLGLGPG